MAGQRLSYLMAFFSEKARNTKSEKKIIKNNHISAIIYLPKGMFKTTAIATNIIVFKKKQKTNDILMINVRKKKQPECKFIIRVNYQTQHY